MPILQEVEDGSRPGHDAADEEGHLDDPVAVDAHEGGGLGILGDGPDAASEARALHELVEDHHDDDGADDDEDVDVRDGVATDREDRLLTTMSGRPTALRELRT